MEKLFQKLVIRVSSGLQMLENIKTTWPAASWFQMFLAFGNPIIVNWPDETLALVVEILHLDLENENSPNNDILGQHITTYEIHEQISKLKLKKSFGYG